MEPPLLVVGASCLGLFGLNCTRAPSAWIGYLKPFRHEMDQLSSSPLLMAFTIGPRIWRRASRLGYYTLGDFHENRYSGGVRGAASSLIWLGSLAILSGQLIGIAWILNAVTGVSKPAGCLIGGLCVTLYFSLVAGILSVVLATLLPSIISALSIFYGLVTLSLFAPVVIGLLSSRPRPPQP